MKTSRPSTALLLLALALPLPGAEGDVPVAPAPPAPPAAVTPGGLITLEFRGARLGQILDRLSEEAGFIIVNPIELANPITLVAKKPLTPEEAIEALNGVLIDQGYTAILRGKTLRVVALVTAKQQNLPVAMGADPSVMAEGDRMVTQVIPVQYATVKDLAENLQPLLNAATSTLAANEASNSLILTDTQTNVRRIASIVQAIDGSVAGVAQVRVFHLANADAEKAASVINEIYGSKSSSRQGNQAQQFLPPFMQGGGGRGNSGGNQAGASSSGTKGGEVVASADTATNSVVVRASPTILAALADVIAQMDVDTTARDSVLVYRARNAKAADLATALTSLFQGTATTSANNNNQRNPGQQQQQAQAASSTSKTLSLSGQVRVVADAVSNTVLVLTLERNFAVLKPILDQMDRPLRQVLVRVLVAEVSIEDGLDVGIQLEGWAPASETTATRAFSNFNLFDSTLGMSGYLLNSSQFRAAVRALASNTRFDVLSRPYVLTTDNRQAVVNVSQEVPVINGSRTDQNNNITSTFDRRDVGIILTVTPQINSEGRVVLDVTQELSALSDQSIQVAEDVDSPIIRKRTMNTRVAVENGQTVVVGGLVHDQMVEKVSKVPLLGDIPLLGWLFKRTERTKSKTELLVFLTPQVVQEPGELADLGAQLRSEMQLLDAAVEKGLLQRHLDQLMALGVGKPLPAPEAKGAPKDGAEAKP